MRNPIHTRIKTPPNIYLVLKIKLNAFILESDLLLEYNLEAFISIPKQSIQFEYVDMIKLFLMLFLVSQNIIIIRQQSSNNTR